MSGAVRGRWRVFATGRAWTHVVAVVLALCGVAGGPAAEERTVFEGRTDVVTVEVPVTVLDADGEPVPGLTAADFALFDDGEEQQITGFEAVDRAAFDAADLFSNRGATPPPSVRRRYLLLFDLSFTDPGAILRARTAAREWVLASLGPADLAAVMIYSLEVGPRLIMTFTSDRALLARALDGLGTPEQLAPATRDPLRFLLPETGGTSLGGSTLETGGTSGQTLIDGMRFLGLELERSQKAYERGRIGSWARSLTELARTLAAVNGRKEIVYFSAGFDGALLFGGPPDAAAAGGGEAAGGAGDRRADAEAARRQLDRERGRLWALDAGDVYGDRALLGEVEQLLEALRRADCTVQAIDVAGLLAGRDAAASRARRNGLFYIARGTGGDLYDGLNDFGAQLDRLRRRTALVYVLAFTPMPLAADGRYHRLRVEPRDRARGLRLVHRAGYYAPRPFVELHPLEKSLLAADAVAVAEPRSDSAVSLLAPAFPVDAGAYVPVIVEVSGAVLAPARPDGELHLELYAYATGERGEIHASFHQSVHLDAERSRELATLAGVKYYGDFNLAPGRYLVRTLVRNAETGRTEVQATTVQATDVQATAVEVGGEGRTPTLLPPFFIEPPERWLLLRSPRDAGGDGRVVYPFTVDGEPFVPAALPRLWSGQAARLCVMAYNLAGEDLIVRLRWLDAAGRAVAEGRLDRVERPAVHVAGLDQLVATFHPPELAPGRYTLEVAVTGADGVRAASTIEVAVGQPLINGRLRWSSTRSE